MTRAKKHSGDHKLDTLELRFTDEGRGDADVRTVLKFDGITLQHVALRQPRAIEYKWLGKQVYASLHDIRLQDGEATFAGERVLPLLDLRDRLTVVPPDCEVEGWSQFAKRTNQFTALYLDPDVVERELEQPMRSPQKPLVHIEDNDLRTTLEKLRMLAKEAHPVDATYAESLAMLAAIEIDRLQRDATPHRPQDRGRLTASQERMIREAIAEGDASNLSLSDLASLAKLSRFHFARAFKKTFGMPPYQFILRNRIEQAKIALEKDEISLADLAKSLGFGSQSRFSEVFRKVTGLSPAQYRRRHR